MGRCSKGSGFENIPPFTEAAADPRGSGPLGVYRCGGLPTRGPASTRPRGSRRLRATGPTASSPREALLTETCFLATRRQARSRVPGTRLPAEVPSVGGGASAQAGPRPCTLRSRLGQSEHGLFPSAEKHSPISERRRRSGNSVLEWAGPPRPGGSLRALVAPRGGDLDAGAGKAAWPRHREPAREPQGGGGPSRGPAGRPEGPTAPRGLLPTAGIRSFPSRSAGRGWCRFSHVCAARLQVLSAGWAAWLQRRTGRPGSRGADVIIGEDRLTTTWKGVTPSSLDL